MIATDSDSILDRILSRATVADVLRVAGVSVPDNLKKPILCPLHAESRPSFHIQKSGKGYKCFGCGEGGVIKLAVALKLAPDKKSAVDLLAGLYGLAKPLGGHSIRVGRDQRPIAALQIREEAPSPVVTAEDKKALRKATEGCRLILGTPGAVYLVSRGFDSEALNQYDMRFHPSWQGRGEAVVFAGRDQSGKLIAAQGRVLSPGRGPKATSRGRVALGVFATPEALVRGLPGETKPIAITEAPLDAIALALNGLPSIATFGSSNRQAWLVDTLARRNVIIATDDDAAGDRAETEIRGWLRFGTHLTRLLLAAM